MPTDDGKKKITMGPATLIVCFVFLVGLSVLTAYLVARFEYKKELAGMDRRIVAMRISQKALAGRNVELLNSLRKMESEYGRLYTTKTQVDGHALKQEHPVSGQEPHAPKQEHPGPGKIKSTGETVMGPVWVGAGKVATLFGGDLRIVLNQASAGDRCRKGSVVCSISSTAGRQKLCLRTGAPVKFTYRGETYRIHLSGIAGKGTVYHYYISVSR